ncbi:MAG: group II intron reverse transcriptase/maturase, partial [Proteobacteria bacterium]|nr:group II intron reverse transcriptase/maturase [Pseudomonadota bacterium]
MLSNIYLHYVLDLWFEKVIKPSCRGDALIIRFADDFVCAFQYRDDAERFYELLPKRLGKFGLEIATEKTRILKFSRHSLKANGTFEFLGFEFRWVTRRTGKPGVMRRTSPKKLRASVSAFTDWVKENRHKRTFTLMVELRHKMRGYYNYYGVRGNVDSLV